MYVPMYTADSVPLSISEKVRKFLHRKWPSEMLSGQPTLTQSNSGQRHRTSTSVTRGFITNPDGTWCHTQFSSLNDD
jgi:hypothetical protein